MIYLVVNNFQFQLYRRYLSQFDRSLGYIGVDSQPPADCELLVVPPMNAFPPSVPCVLENHSEVTIPVSSNAQRFYYETLNQYVERDIPIVCLGESADMLWTNFGGKLIPNHLLSKKEEYNVAIYGFLPEHIDRSGPSVTDINNPNFKYRVPFHQFVTINQPKYFNLVEKPQTLEVLGYESHITRSNFARLKSEAKGATLCT
jgi:hypothetical protein